MVSLCRSHSPTQDEFDIFLINFEQWISDIITKNPLLVLITGNFNVRSSNWWKNDLPTSEGTQVDSFTISYGLSQIISDPTHILSNSSSCIDLIFTNQPNLVTESGVYPSLHPKLHSILKTFVKGKKVPIIPRLFVNDKFVTNFLEKANVFNEFFSKHC